MPTARNFRVENAAFLFEYGRLMTVDLESARNAARIAFGALSLARTLQLARFRRSLWAGKLTSSTRDALLVFQAVSALLIAVGLFSFPAALVHFFASARLTRTSWRGGETALWQALAFYFVFAAGGSGFSLDRLWHLPTFTVFPVESPLPEYALAVALGGFALRLASHLKRDPFWRGGFVLTRFLADPRLRRIGGTAFPDVRSRPKLDKFVFVFSLLILPLWLTNGFPVGAACALFLTVAGCALATAFTFLWTGTALSLAGTLVATTLVSAASDGIARSFVSAILNAEGFVGKGVALTLLVFTLVATVPIRRSKILRRASDFAAAISWGLPRWRDLSGGPAPYAYRAFFVNFAGGLNEPFRIFNGDGRPAKDAFLLPEYLIAMGSAIRRAEREFAATKTMPEEAARLLTAFAQDLFTLCRKRLGQAPAKLLFRIAEIPLPGSAAAEQNLTGRDRWRDAFQVEFSGPRAVRIRKFAKAA